MLLLLIHVLTLKGFLAHFASGLYAAKFLAPSLLPKSKLFSKSSSKDGSLFIAFPPLFMFSNVWIYVSYFVMLLFFVEL